MSYRVTKLAAAMALEPKKARAQIQAALKKTKGNAGEAAKLLGVHRNSLRNYLVRLDLVPS